MSGYASILGLAILVGGPPTDYAAVGGEVVRIVREQFYDRARAAAWAKSHADYAADAHARREFARRTNQALADLKASHTAYFTPDDVEYYGLCAIFGGTLKGPVPKYDSIGADFARLPDGFFVRTIFAGSPAEKAGLLRGDRIVSADGAPFEPVASFRGRSDQDVVLQIQRQARAPLLEKRVKPRRVNAKEEWLEAQRRGGRVIECAGKRIGYIPLFSGAGTEHQAMVEDALRSVLQTADALILDFRNGWGGCSPEFVNLFNRNVPTLAFITRSGESRQSGAWHKPVVVLINRGSRSGKEVVSFALQKHKRATLVGERTAGAVLAGSPHLLSDHSLLFLAVLDIRVDGQVLEGKGVEPDIPVVDGLPYAGGKDAQLDKALQVAANLCPSRARSAAE
jgi:carboxyl-terminal processing protease